MRAEYAVIGQISDVGCCRIEVEEKDRDLSRRVLGIIGKPCPLFVNCDRAERRTINTRTEKTRRGRLDLLFASPRVLRGKSCLFTSSSFLLCNGSSVVSQVADERTPTCGFNTEPTTNGRCQRLDRPVVTRRSTLRS